MGTVTGVAVYFVVWWIVLFAVLPWGVRTSDTPEPGMADGAPQQPHLLKKFAATTVLAALVWGLIYLGVTSDWISFREMAKGMQ